MRSRIRGTLLWLGVAAGLWAAPAGALAQRSAPRPATVRFQARSPTVHAADAEQAAGTLPSHPPLNSGALPGVSYASVTPLHMAVAGKLTAWAASVSQLDGDGSGMRMFPSSPPISMGALRLETLLRLGLSGKPGDDYLIVCTVSDGVYSVRNAVRPAGIVQTYHTDSEGYLAFVLEDAVAGEAIFEIESSTPWSWTGCEARTLT
jgi:hypothetical protein